MTPDSTQPPSGTRKRMLFRKRFLIPLVLLATYMLFQPTYRIRLLRNAAKDATEVRIVLSEPENVKRVVARIQGREKVDELLDLIALRPSLLGCRCGSMTTIELCRDGEPVVRLNVMPEKLWWIQGSWPSTVTMTSTSAAELHAWMERNGGSELMKARKENEQLWAQWRAKLEAEYGETKPSSAPAEAATRAAG